MDAVRAAGIGLWREPKTRNTRRFALDIRGRIGERQTERCGLGAARAARTAGALRPQAAEVEVAPRLGPQRLDPQRTAAADLGRPQLIGEVPASWSDRPWAEHRAPRVLDRAS